MKCGILVGGSNCFYLINQENVAFITVMMVLLQALAYFFSVIIFAAWDRDFQMISSAREKETSCWPTGLLVI